MLLYETASLDIVKNAGVRKRGIGSPYRFISLRMWWCGDLKSESRRRQRHVAFSVALHG